MTHRLLIVDDSPVVRAQMKLFLEQEGFDVVEAKDGKDGLHQVEGTNPDLILSDLSMPRMSGIEMLRQLRAQGCSTPAFVLSTDMSKELLAEGKSVGVMAWMVKPFKPDALLKGIKKVLG